MSKHVFMACYLTCIMQVIGNPCPPHLPPALKPGAPQTNCRSSFLPSTRSRGSTPVYLKNEVFPGPGLLPKSPTQMGQIAQTVQMKKRILLLQLKQYLNAREAPRVQHLQKCRRNSYPSHGLLQIAGNFHAQLHRLADHHPSLRPEGSSPGLWCACVCMLKEL